MLFIEYNETWVKFSEQELTIEEMQRVVYERTKRVIELKASIDKPSLFSLIHQPNVGFFLIANQDIPEGTILCSYRGVYIPKKAGAFVSEAHQSYLLEQVQDQEAIGHLQARERGGLASLLAHLPNANQEMIDTERCQSANCTYTFSKRDAIFSTTKPIKCGDIIGYDYGPQYWNNIFINPIYFSINGLQEALHTVTLNHFFSFFDAATGMLLKINDAHYFWIMSAEAVRQKLWPAFMAHMMGLDKKPCTRLVHEAVSVEVNTEQLFTLLTNRSTLKPTTFFGVHSKVQGCMPPPGSKFEEGRTLAPKV